MLLDYPYLYSYDDELDASYSGRSFANEVDAKGGCIVPGLVDGHTHPVWVGDRVNEFAMKVRRGKRDNSC